MNRAVVRKKLRPGLIGFRASVREREIILKAADLHEKSLSAFARDACYRVAIATVNEREGQPND